VMPADEEKTDHSGLFILGFITGLFVGAAIVTAFWVMSMPHFNTMPDLELNPCMGWGTTNGQEFPAPNDQWYHSVCPNRTSESVTNLPLYKMYDEERCRCYEYKNWWKFVTPSSMFR
jgi:hypothetical protein